jgi:hypothetical protein
MQAVLQHILLRTHDYARLPFFDFLRDDTLRLADRLAFYPCMAGFVMSFGDLNRHVLRVEPTDDPHQAVVNAHTREDDHHWRWYLDDLSRLGFDQVARPSETLRHLYSEDCAQGRLLAHRLVHLAWGATPAVRLAVIEAIEQTGHVLLSVTAGLAARYQRASRVELRFLGELHLARESGHAMGAAADQLACIALDDVSRRHAMQCVDQVFAAFSAWTEELLAYARARVTGPAHRRREPTVP